MEKIIGKVKEVYLPLEYKNNQVLDIMFRTNIGFTIETNNKLTKYTFKMDEFNSQILKDDLVIITKQIIDNQEFIDIRKCEAYE